MKTIKIRYNPEKLKFQLQEDNRFIYDISDVVIPFFNSHMTSALKRASESPAHWIVIQDGLEDVR